MKKFLFLILFFAFLFIFNANGQEQTKQSTSAVKNTAIDGKNVNRNAVNFIPTRNFTLSDKNVDNIDFQHVRKRNIENNPTLKTSTFGVVASNDVTNISRTEIENNVPSNSWSKSTGIYSLFSENRWSKEGIYGKYSPKDELVELRGKDSKTFYNSDGTRSLMLIGRVHYEDDFGKWQDIDVSIKNENGIFVNKTNDFKSFYPQTTKDGLKILYNKNEFEFWKNTKIFLDNNKISNYVAPQQDDYRSLSYKIAQDIDYQMIQLETGIEGGYWLKNKNIFYNTDNMRIEQEFILPENCYFEVNGERQYRDFEAKNFNLMFSDGSFAFSFRPIVIFDASFSFDEIMANMSSIKIVGGNNNQDIELKNKHKLEVNYKLKYEGNKIIIYFDIPTSWLLDNNTVFPVFVDPTVMIDDEYDGATVSINTYSFYSTTNSKTRWDFLLENGQNGFNVPNGATIMEINLLYYADPPSVPATGTINNPRIRLNNRADLWSPSSWVTTGWQDCYKPSVLPSPLQYPQLNNYAFDPSNYFTYNNSYGGLLVGLLKDNGSYTFSGGGTVVNSTTTSKSRGGYGSSGSLPFDTGLSSFTNPAYRPLMIITYIGGYGNSNDPIYQEDIVCGQTYNGTVYADDPNGIQLFSGTTQCSSNTSAFLYSGYVLYSFTPAYTTQYTINITTTNYCAGYFILDDLATDAVISAIDGESFGFSYNPTDVNFGVTSPINRTNIKPYLNAGQEYYILIGNPMSFSNVNYNISIDCINPCSISTTIACGTQYTGSVYITNSTAYALGTSDYYYSDHYNDDCSNSWGAGEWGAERVYSFQPTNSGYYNIYGNGTNNNNAADFFISTSSCTNNNDITAFNCMDAGNMLPYLTGGQTYYIYVDGYVDVDENPPYDILNLNIPLNYELKLTFPPTKATGIILTANSLPVSSVCSGTTISLSANGGQEGGGCTYQWARTTNTTQPGSSNLSGNTISITDSPTAVGSSQTYYYWVRRVSNSTCTGNVTTDWFMSSMLTVNPLPTVSIVSNPICVAATTTLSPSINGTWTSSNPSIASVTNVGLVTGESAGSATFTYTETLTGCSATTASVTVNALPIISILGSNPICVGATTTLDPTIGGTWTSSNPSIASVTNAGLVTGLSSGSATFTFEETSTGCTATTASVTINAAPIVTITGNNSICIGATTTLDPTTDGTWTSNNPSIASITNAGLVTGLSSGSATFTFEETSTGCSATTASVTINAAPIIPSSIDDIISCTSSIILQTNQGSDDYKWYDEMNTLVTGAVTESGTYTLVVSNSNCSSTKQINVLLSEWNIDLTIYSTPCSAPGVSDGTATVYFEDYTGLTINWSTGESTATIYGLSAGTYYVTISNDISGCVLEGSVEVFTNIGIISYEISAITVYPNPFNNNINISLEGISDNNIIIEIYDINGKIVQRNNIQIEHTNGTSIVTLPINNIVSGVYNLRTITKDRIFNHSIVKQE